MKVLGTRIEILGVTALLLVLAVLAPLFILTKFPTLEWSYVWVFVIGIMGLNLLTGFGGQISLGNGAFMAIGGYTTGILVWKLQWPYLATIPLAGLLAGVIGFLFGIPALKLRGLYLALATFALAISAPSVIRNYGELTGGHQGIILRPPHDPFGLVDSANLTVEQWMYYVALVIAILLYLFARAVVRGQTGRALKAIRDSETAAVASGISLTRYKTMAFGLSAFYAGIAGSLYGIITAYVSPDSYDLPLSLQLLVGTVVGGLGTLLGPILGAIFVQWLPIYAQQVKLPSGQQLRPDIVYGVVIILLMIFMPQGIVGGFYRAYFWYQRRRRAGRGTRPLAAEPLPVGGAATESDGEVGSQ